MTVLSWGSSNPNETDELETRQQEPPEHSPQRRVLLELPAGAGGLLLAAQQARQPAQGVPIIEELPPALIGARGLCKAGRAAIAALP